MPILDLDLAKSESMNSDSVKKILDSDQIRSRNFRIRSGFGPEISGFGQDSVPKILDSVDSDSVPKILDSDSADSDSPISDSD